MRSLALNRERRGHTEAHETKECMWNQTQGHSGGVSEK